MTELSIRAAAAEAPDRPALITADATYTFADLAALLAPPPATLVATPTLETILAILAAFEARVPITLVHPKLTKLTPSPFAVSEVAQLDGDGVNLVNLYTSGSTAAPRPIALRRDHAIAAATASAANLGWRDDDAWLLNLPLAHVGGLSIIIRCLIARRPIILAPSHPLATLASVVPAQLPELDRTAKLRAVLVGGAATPRALREAAIARGLPILTTYGMTETWGQVATQPLARAGCLDDGVGVPLPGVTITAGTPEAPAPIHITAPYCAPTTSADLGFLDERGWLHVTGRADDVIITGGENVHPLAIEEILARAPGVLDVCACGVPDPRWGERIVAAVVLDPATTVDAVVAFARSHLPSHQRPRELHQLPALPRTATGKPDRRALRDDLLHRALHRLPAALQ